MKKINLYNKDRSLSVSSLMDTTKISEIEFELDIDDKDTLEEIQHYIRQLENENKLYYHYKKAVVHKNYYLLYFVDNIGNKSFLTIESGEEDYEF